MVASAISACSLRLARHVEASLLLAEETAGSEQGDLGGSNGIDGISKDMGSRPAAARVVCTWDASVCLSRTATTLARTASKNSLSTIHESAEENRVDQSDQNQTSAVTALRAAIATRTTDQAAAKSLPTTTMIFSRAGKTMYIQPTMTTAHPAAVLFSTPHSNGQSSTRVVILMAFGWSSGVGNLLIF